MSLPWYHQTSIYQIYPRSFFDGNGDGIGDLEGIIQKLDYIKDLGFETIWVSPFYDSPQKDFGYDICNYLAVAPEYGTMEDADRLMREVHARGMKIVLDMVMNHTSDEHQWFHESRESADNAKADWYIWRDKPNNWKAITGPSGWHYAAHRNQYYYASFLPFQPDLNYRNPELKQKMFEICRFWLDKGVDGFRLDIFNCILKDPGFRDNPFSLFLPFPTEEWPGGNFQKRIYSTNWPENEDFARELRQVADAFDPPRLLLGEVFGGHEKIRKFLGTHHDGLHLIFLFDILFFKFKASFFREKIEAFNHYYPPPYMPTIVFSNHDQHRSMHRLGNDMHKAKLLAVLHFTLRGVPTLYNGEEIGMTNVPLPVKDGKDALSETYKWMPQWIVDLLPIPLNRDVCRTPVHWNDGPNAGFSTGTPWLPVHANYKNTNIASQQKNTDSLWWVYKKVIELRKAHPALHEGDISLIEGNSDDLLAFERKAGKEKLVVYVNFSNKAQKVPAAAGTVIFSLSGNDHREKDALQIFPFSACILQK